MTKLDRNKPNSKPVLAGCKMKSMVLKVEWSDCSNIFHVEFSYFLQKQKNGSVTMQLTIDY